MDCYIVKRKYRCNSKNYKGKPFKYQTARLSFVFKNYKIKTRSKEQIIIIDFDLIFPANKLVVIVNKNNLLRKIKTNCVRGSIKYLTFSIFNTEYKSDKFINVIDLKKLKINLKEEDLEYIFNFTTSTIRGIKIKIDNKQKELNFNDNNNSCRDYLFYQLDNQSRIEFYTELHYLINSDEIAALKSL